MFIYLKYGESRTERTVLLRTIRTYRQFIMDTPPQEPRSDTQSDVGSDQITDKTIDRARAAHEHLLSYIIHRDVDAEELEKAFGWNLETYTGFRDMRPEQMSANIYSRTLELMAKVIETIGKMKTSGKAD